MNSHIEESFNKQEFDLNRSWTFIESDDSNSDSISIISEDSSHKFHGHLDSSYIKQKNYVHHPNCYLNKHLNLIILLTCAFASGLALGHYIGSQQNQSHLLQNISDLKRSNRDLVKHIEFLNLELQSTINNRTTKEERDSLFDELLKFVSFTEENIKKTNNLIEPVQDFIKDMFNNYQENSRIAVDHFSSLINSYGLKEKSTKLFDKVSQFVKSFKHSDNNNNNNNNKCNENIPEKNFKNYDGQNLNKTEDNDVINHNEQQYVVKMKPNQEFTKQKEAEKINENLNNNREENYQTKDSKTSTKSKNKNDNKEFDENEKNFQNKNKSFKNRENLNKKEKDSNKKRKNKNKAGNEVNWYIRKYYDKEKKYRSKDRFTNENGEELNWYVKKYQAEEKQRSNYKL